MSVALVLARMLLAHLGDVFHGLHGRYPFPRVEYTWIGKTIPVDVVCDDGLDE